MSDVVSLAWPGAMVAYGTWIRKRLPYMRPRTTSIEPSVQNGHRGGRGGPSRRPIGEGGGGKVGCCVSTLVISLVVIGGAISAVSTMVVRGIPQPAMDLATRRRARKPAA